MPGSMVNAMPGSSGAGPAADVVHVDADVVRGAVRVPQPILVAARVGDQPELQQAGLDHLHRLRVDVLQRRARPRRLDALLLRLQHDPVDVLLQRRERAADRIGPGDVARHVVVVAGGVDEQQVAGLHLPVAVGVVEDGRVRPAADNRGIAPRDGAAAAVHRLDRGFHLVLVGAGAGGAHAGHLRLAGDLEALDQDLALVRRLDRPQTLRESASRRWCRSRRTARGSAARTAAAGSADRRGCGRRPARGRRGRDPPTARRRIAPPPAS